MGNQPVVRRSFVLFSFCAWLPIGTSRSGWRAEAVPSSARGPVEAKRSCGSCGVLVAETLELGRFCLVESSFW